MKLQQNLAPENNEVLISNVFPDANKGGATITWATIEAVREAFPGSHISLLPVQVRSEQVLESYKYTIKRYPDVNILPPFGVPRAERFSGGRAFLRSLSYLTVAANDQDKIASRIRSARAVVSKGGYVFVDRRTVGDLLSFWITVLPLLVAIRSGVPAMAIGATVGPFKNPVARRMVGWVLRRLTALIVRDEYSEITALQLGVHRDRLFRTPDVVFAYDPPYADESASIRKDMGVNGSYAVVTLAVGDINNAFHTALRYTLRKALDDRLVDRVYFPLQSMQDKNVTKDFVSIMDDKRVVMMDDDLSPVQLMALYGGAKISVARRMHAAIFSLLVGTPTLACAKYGYKVEGVMKSIGMEDIIVPYADFESSNINDLFFDMAASQDTFRQRVERAIARARDELRLIPAVLQNKLS